MTIVVCDDNRSFGLNFLSELEDHANTAMRSVGKFWFEYLSTAADLYSYLKENHVDILFLDISMPKEDGFSAAEKIKKTANAPLLIFVTNYEEKVFYSFHYQPFRFVRKSNIETEGIEAFEAAVQSILNDSRKIIVKNQSQTVSLSITDIVYYEKEKRSNYVLIHTPENNYRFRGTTEDFKRMLGDVPFLEVGHKTFVSPRHVRLITGNEILLTSGEKIRISDYISTKYLTAEFIKYIR